MITVGEDYMYEKTQKTVNNPTHLIVCSQHVRSVVRATIRGNWCMVRTTVKLKNAAITRIIRYILQYYTLIQMNQLTDFCCFNKEAELLLRSDIVRAHHPGHKLFSAKMQIIVFAKD